MCSGLSVDKELVETVSHPVIEFLVGLDREGFEIVWAHHPARTQAECLGKGLCTSIAPSSEDLKLPADPVRFSPPIEGQS